MNKDLLETQWVEAREFLRDKWNRLTDDDIRQINGRFDQLLDKLQQRYGLSREQAEEEIRRWNVEKASKPAYSERSARSSNYQDERSSTRREAHSEKSDALKWLLGLGIPLLFLLGYLGSNAGPTNTQSVSRAPNQEVFITGQTPADQALGQTIRQALMANGMNIQDLRSIRISASNGVVTLNGTVATPEQRTRINDAINNLAGVQQVNNQLEVRP